MTLPSLPTPRALARWNDLVEAIGVPVDEMEPVAARFLVWFADMDKDAFNGLVAVLAEARKPQTRRIAELTAARDRLFECMGERVGGTAAGAR